MLLKIQVLWAVMPSKQTVTHMSKDSSAFIFRVKQENFWPWKRRCSKPSECWLLFTHQYSTTPQKTWNFLQWLVKMHTSQCNELGEPAFSAKIIQIPPIQIAREHVPESSWYSMPPWLNVNAKHRFYQAHVTHLTIIWNCEHKHSSQLIILFTRISKNDTQGRSHAHFLHIWSPEWMN